MFYVRIVILFPVVAVARWVVLDLRLYVGASFYRHDDCFLQN
jgi:hypothetical protein